MKRSDWYRKRTDAQALYVARQCGCAERFELLGDVLYWDDLLEALPFLELRLDTVLDYLFEPTTLETP